MIDMGTCVYIIIIILNVQTKFNAKYLILIAYSVQSYLQNLCTSFNIKYTHRIIFDYMSHIRLCKNKNHSV